MSEAFTEDDASQIDIDVPEWQTTHDAVRDWYKSDNKSIHVLRQVADTLILVQRDSEPATEYSTEGEKVVGLSIHADDNIVIQAGTGHEQGFDATEDYVGDYGTIEEAVAVTLGEFA